MASAPSTQTQTQTQTQRHRNIVFCTYHALAVPVEVCVILLFSIFFLPYYFSFFLVLYSTKHKQLSF